MANDRPRLLDLLVDRDKLGERIVDQARQTISTHVARNILDNVVRPRIDEVLGRVRRR